MKRDRIRRLLRKLKKDRISRLTEKIKKKTGLVGSKEFKKDRPDRYRDYLRCT